MTDKEWEEWGEEMQNKWWPLFWEDICKLKNIWGSEPREITAAFANAEEVGEYYAADLQYDEELEPYIDFKAYGKDIVEADEYMIELPSGSVVLFE